MLLNSNTVFSVKLQKILRGSGNLTWLSIRMTVRCWWQRQIVLHPKMKILFLLLNFYLHVNLNLSGEKKIQLHPVLFFTFFSHTSSYKARMELETTGPDQIISPGTSVWAPLHHLRPQVTSVTCGELHHRPALPCPGRAVWGRLAGAGSTTSCWTAGRCTAICKLRYS